MKKIFLVAAFFAAFLLSFNVAKDVFALIRSKLIKVDSVNLTYHDIIFELKGKVLVHAVPVVAPASGVIEYLVNDLTYVEENNPLLIIKGDSEFEVVAPKKGVFIRNIGNYYLTDEKDISQINFQNYTFKSLKEGEKVQGGEIIGSLSIDGSFYIAIEKNSNLEDSNVMSILVGDVFTEMKPESVLDEGNYMVFRFTAFLPELINKSVFKFSLGKAYSFQLERNEIVEKNAQKGVYIINGDRVFFLPLKIISTGNGLLGIVDDEKFSQYRSFLVVNTPTLLREGEVIGGF